MDRGGSTLIRGGSKMIKGRFQMGRLLEATGVAEVWHGGDLEGFSTSLERELWDSCGNSNER